MSAGRALITGGPGFVGRRVVIRLLDAGWEVTSLSLPGEPAPDEWAGRVRIVHGDLADPAGFAPVAADADLIVHLAAPVGVAGRYDWQWRIMVDGTTALLEAARPGARVVLASSIAVYGDRIQQGACREDDGFGAWQGAYGRAKQGEERAAAAVAAERGLALAIVRPANVYGLGGGGAWGDRLLDWIRASGGAVIGDGETNDAGLVHVDNLADALVLAGTHEAAHGGTYNVCDGNGVTWRRFMDDMAAIAGMPPPPAWPLAPVLEAACANEDPATLGEPVDPALPSLEGLNLVGFDNRIDSSRIRRELGWGPRVNYAEAMAAAGAEAA